MAVAALAAMLTLSVGAAEETCPHCKTPLSQINWEPWAGTAGDLNTTGHYRLAADYEQNGQVKLTGGDLVVDLAGHALSTTANRPFYVNGGTLTILDTVGSAVVSGKATASGSTLFVNANGTLNIYGGTYESAANTGKDGGTIAINGHVTLHNGTIKGSYSSTAGGCLQLSKGSFTMNGGMLTAGTATTSGGTIFAKGGTLNLNGGVIEAGTVGSGKSGTAVFAYRAADTAPCTVNIGSVTVPTSARNSVVIGTNTTVNISGAPKLGYFSSSSAITIGELTDGASVFMNFASKVTLTAENKNLPTYLQKGYLRAVAVGKVLAMENSTTLVAAAYDCPCCDTPAEEIVWESWSGGALESGKHYCLNGDLEKTAQVSISEAATIDLHGRNITSTTRAFYVSGKLNLTDSQKGATVIGKQTGNGGVLYVAAGGELSLYGGNYLAGAKSAKGGVAYVPAGGHLWIYDAVLDGNGFACAPVCIGGKAEMLGGEIKGSTVSTLGGSVLVTNTGYFHLAGGKISGGDSTNTNTAYPKGGDNVYLEGGTMVISGGTIEAADAKSLGTAVLGMEYANLTITGTADPETLSGKVLTDSSCTFTATIGAGAINGYSRETWYHTIDKAAKSTHVLLRLYSSGQLAMHRDETVDLNGQKLTVTGDYTFSGFDSTATTRAAGNGEAFVEGAVEEIVVRDGDRFIALTENGSTTFHRLRLRISRVSLRPDAAGIYYTTEIGCDPVLAEKISRYGVAMSLQAMPDETFAETGLYTWTDTENFVGGSYTGGMVKGILKAGNQNNANRAEMTIYANPYIYLDGKLVMGLEGDTAGYNLHQVMESVNRQYPTLNAEQTPMVGAFYEKFSAVMADWKLHNIQAGDREVKHLKVLTLGHSLAVDAGRMLAAVADAEGATDITVGTLYYSGCTLPQHVAYLQDDIPCYMMYYSSTATADRAPITTHGVTMAEGLLWEDWDIVVMQAGVFEAGRPAEYNDNIQIITDYVLAHCPEATLMWNMTWAAPEDESLLNASYKSNFQTYFGMDQLKMHDAICNAVQTKILTNPIFEGVIPTGTAIQNANSSYLTDKDLYRDYIHITDLGRLIAAYIWYCTLTDRQVTQLQLDVIPGFLRHNAADQKTDLLLTEQQKAIVLESVQNAIANPYQVTQSQYK